MNDDNQGKSREILKEAADKHEDQPGEAKAHGGEHKDAPRVSSSDGPEPGANPDG